ncbi:pilus (MSHA type) biogenesis protein MshL [Desulfuromonas versatilis]|uniref:Pilus (MSHA type) biogenesis protein MshL n=1 Tax=Desulfuromonas versatilis TaxID=2802975 RepID=A0ABN6E251_9BACT|nr:pilus (MSHA type) biogenesis protein MshL [Desulfuromonas versatilis]BCR06405.1 pilus (MSHA type) biogenesis protein MshL [Desulfuromonas versatilis]
MWPNVLSATRCLLLTALLFAWGCAPPPRGADAGREIGQALQEPAQAPAPVGPVILPPEISTALLPPAVTGMPMAAAEPRFDISAKKTPAAEFFMGLVAGSPYNMVVHPEVSGEITLSLKNATIPEVMEVVRNVYGYPFHRTETGFQVMPFGLQSKVFYVNYLNLVRRGVSQTRVSSGQVSEVVEDKNGQEDSQRAVSGSRIDTESLADFWRELAAALQAIVGSHEGRQVVVQPQAGVVVVRAMPEELQGVEAYLTAIQGTLQRQVILEAKILEVELSDGFQSGINWAALGRPGQDKTIVIGQTGGGTLFNQGISEIAGNSGTLNPLDLLLPEGTDTSAFGGVFSAALNLKDFTAFIELLETQGNVQVLSSPRISTVNNQKAVIKVGSDEFFVTDISSDTVTGTTATTTSDITLTPFFSGIALDVTPQIDSSGGVTLHIHPTISEVRDQQKTVTVGERPQILPLALSTVRESDSIVRARSGQVVVIGGLMQNSVVKDVASVPYLGKVPLLGPLFRHTQSSSRKSELVILLRPLVVQDSQAWDSEVSKSRQRIEGMGAYFQQGWQHSLTEQQGFSVRPAAR